MSKYIGTQLHDCAEIAPDDHLIEAMSHANHFVIDDRLLAILSREDVSASIMAMVEAEIAKLPFSELLIEFYSNDRTRQFVLLREAPNAITAQTATLGGRCALIVRSSTSATVRLTTSGVSVDNSDGENDARVIGFAVGVALLMMNLRGIQRERIECDPLNRKRERTGKRPIPDHTVLRIGTITLSDGREVNFGSDEHRHMRIHMRAGHARHQAHGPDRSERKLIYIPPTIVGIGAREEIQPKRRVIAP